MRFNADHTGRLQEDEGVKTGEGRATFGAKEQRELEDALAAMTAEELRSFLLDAVDRLDEEPRVELLDFLVVRAATGASGWKPASPPAGTVDKVKEFVAAARRLGCAEPSEADAYLRVGTRAFLAGDVETAHAILESLLLPMADAEIDLGQHEMVDEVLTVDIHGCAAQYVMSVYVTTPLDRRAEAVHLAMKAVRGITSFWSPLEQLEQIAAVPLPDLDHFLPLWLRYLEEQPSSEGEWESDLDRWLREAALRLEGVAGLERIARKSKKPETLRTWCDALAELGDWPAALRACDDAAEMLGASHWRGDFLDGAALAARQLGRSDAVDRLEAAWLAAPSLVRLLRWLGADTQQSDEMNRDTIVERARKAIKECPAKSGSQLGLLYVLTGNAQAAADILANAPGLGWSNEGHPGRVLFPEFAGLLVEGTTATLAPKVYAELRKRWWDPACLLAEHENNQEVPQKLTVPSILELIVRAVPGEGIEPQGRLAMFKAMQTAAARRLEGVLENKHRRSYGHAAILIACCLELSPVIGERDSVANWIDGLRRECSRFKAFQRELETALGSITEA